MGSRFARERGVSIFDVTRRNLLLPFHRLLRHRQWTFRQPDEFGSWLKMHSNLALSGNALKVVEALRSLPSNDLKATFEGVGIHLKVKEEPDKWLAPRVKGAEAHEKLLRSVMNLLPELKGKNTDTGAFRNWLLQHSSEQNISRLTKVITRDVEEQIKHEQAELDGRFTEIDRRYGLEGTKISSRDFDEKKANNRIKELQVEGKKSKKQLDKINSDAQEKIHRLSTLLRETHLLSEDTLLFLGRLKGVKLTLTEPRPMDLPLQVKSMLRAEYPHLLVKPTTTREARGLLSAYASVYSASFKNHFARLIRFTPETIHDALGLPKFGEKINFSRQTPPKPSYTKAANEYYRSSFKSGNPRHRPPKKPSIRSNEKKFELIDRRKRRQQKLKERGLQ